MDFAAWFVAMDMLSTDKSWSKLPFPQSRNTPVAHLSNTRHTGAYAGSHAAAITATATFQSKNSKKKKIKKCKHKEAQYESPAAKPWSFQKGAVLSNTLVVRGVVCDVVVCDVDPGLHRCSLLDAAVIVW